MIWLTWRQFRTQALVAAAALVAMAIALAATGPHLAHLYDTSGIMTCRAHGNCADVSADFLTGLKDSSLYKSLFYLSIAILYAAPAIIGVFWGAPLITRELESGTLRLAWNQSVTRSRWLAVKLGLIGLVSVTVVGALCLMVTWWGGPIERAAPLLDPRQAVSLVNRFAPLLFGARGVAPLGYAALAFVLGVTVGVLVRRTVPAMAVTLAAFAGVQFVMALVVRQHLATPVRSIAALNPAAIQGLMISGSGQMRVTATVDRPSAWVLSNQVVDAAGHPFAGQAPSACARGTFQACQASMARLHLRQLVTYQPATRYWEFQWYETAIVLALAVALAGCCFWWVRRRLS